MSDNRMLMLVQGVVCFLVAVVLVLAVVVAIDCTLKWREVTADYAELRTVIQLTADEATMAKINAYYKINNPTKQFNLKTK